MSWSAGGWTGSAAASATWSCCSRNCRGSGVGFVSLGEGIDLGTPAGRLQLHILAALAEFERSRIQERVRAGLARVRASGRRLGRPVSAVPLAKLEAVAGLSIREGAKRLRVSRSTLQRWRALARADVSQQTPAAAD